MRFILVLIISLSFTYVVGNWYFSTENICPVPITYQLGDIDSRFNINDVEAKKVLSDAENLWEEALGRDLFIYDEDSSFTLNFIYDERQQLASTEEEWRLALDAKEEKGLEMVEEVKKQTEEYEQEQKKYLESRADYENKLTAYNEKVERYNEEGGAPEAIYLELQEEQNRLSVLLKELTNKEKTLNKQIDEINGLGNESNRLIELYNQEVLQYNAIYGDRDIYTQGDFRRDRINIYKFSDKTELTKVVAHEFGHALGLDHVEGTKSMMYYLMDEQPDELVLSEEDINALIITCGVSDSYTSKVRRIIRNLLSKLPNNI